MTEKILTVIKQLRETSKKRNFPQTFDLIVNLKELDLKKPENKINEEFVLPHGKGQDSVVAIFSDSYKVEGAKVYTSVDIDKFSKNKRLAKKLVKETDFIYAEPKLMALVGKTFGQFLGPKGKIPKVITADPNALVKNLSRAVRIRIKDSPVIQVPVGKENMKDAQIGENVEEVVKHLQTRLPKGKANIAEVFIKLTMSKPVKIEVEEWPEKQK